MKKVLVTGGLGFIGSHTVDELLRKEYQVFILDNFSTGNLKNIDNRKVKIVKGDIQDKKLVDKIMKKMDYVIHLAAVASVSESVKNPIKTHFINVDGTLNVFISALENNVKKVVYASSAAIYGNNQNIPLGESFLPQPISPYGMHKNINEQYASLLNKNKKTKFIGLRYFNVYGSRQSLTGGYPAVVPIFCLNSLKDKKISILGDGKQYRDFIYVKDLAKINVLALEKDQISFEVFNVGTGVKLDINTLIKNIEKILNKKVEVDKKEAREGDIKKSLADISRLRKIFKLDFTPFSEGLKETLEYYKENKN